MNIVNYSRVKLLTNAYLQEGVGMGSIGYVIEIYPHNKYEVEFSGENGVSIAQVVVNDNEIALDESVI